MKCLEEIELDQEDLDRELAEAWGIVVDFLLPDIPRGLVWVWVGEEVGVVDGDEEEAGVMVEDFIQIHIIIHLIYHLFPPRRCLLHQLRLVQKMNQNI